ncbi:MAG: TetR/AcrR family transcriptional regulator [Anaerolineae bacterium]|nr:TetR/AcrR family transcriptional regulator [Anaerolineae bacterium]
MPNGKDESKQTARDQILETAAALFFREGFRAVGVDTIIKQADVAKMTLYRYFPSKDDLIVAYLQDSNEKFWAWFADATAGAGDPRAQIVAFFKALARLVTTPTCYGCPFLNAIVDFPDDSHPGHQVALEHKQAVRARFYDLAREAGAHTPDVLADQLLLLMDGAFMAVRMFGVRNPAAHVAEAAAALIDAQM